MNKKVLITGISGFLGSQIAEELVAHDFIVAGTVRQNSDLWRCSGFLEKVTWINVDNSDWKQQITDFKPVIFVHSAWQGVWNDRNNWETQLKNIEQIVDLLELTKTLNVEKFIGFGSQAEYGLFSESIDETHDTNPNSAYGLFKHLISQTVKCYSEQNNINWYWLRLFSFFGEKEDDHWFIPMLVKKISTNQPIDMTPGLQQYAYMYVKDLAIAIRQIINSPVEPGIYNLSSKRPIELRKIVEKIVSIIKPENPRINFGAIPYRENQPMIIHGKTTKLESQIGEILETDFDENLEATVNYILKKSKTPGA